MAGLAAIEAEMLANSAFSFLWREVNVSELHGFHERGGGSWTRIVDWYQSSIVTRTNLNINLNSQFNELVEGSPLP